MKPLELLRSHAKIAADLYYYYKRLLKISYYKLLCNFQDSKKAEYELVTKDVVYVKDVSDFLLFVMSKRCVHDARFHSNKTVYT